jgi:fructuronate reductase
VDEAGRPIDVRDPLAEKLRAITDATQGNPTRLVEGMLAVREIFGEDLPQSTPFKNCLMQHLTSLYELGAARTVESMSAT